MGVKQVRVSVAEIRFAKPSRQVAAHWARSANLTHAQQIGTLARRAGVEEIQAWAAASAKRLTPNALVRMLLTAATINEMNAGSGTLSARDRQQRIELLRGLAVEHAQPTSSEARESPTPPSQVPPTRAELSAEATRRVDQVRQAITHQQHDVARELLERLETLAQQARAMPQFTTWANGLSTLTRELEKSVNHLAQTDANLVVGMANPPSREQPAADATPAPAPAPAPANAPTSKPPMELVYVGGDPTKGRTPLGEELFVLANGGSTGTQQQNFEAFAAKWAEWPTETHQMFLLYLQGMTPTKIAQVLIQRNPQTTLSDVTIVSSRLLTARSPVAKSVLRSFGLTMPAFRENLTMVQPPIQAISDWLYRTGSLATTGEDTFTQGLTPQAKRLYEIALGKTPGEKRQSFKLFVGRLAQADVDAQEMVLLYLQGMGPKQLASVLLERFPQTSLRDIRSVDAALTHPRRILPRFAQTAFGRSIPELKEALLTLRRPLPEVSAWLFRGGNAPAASEASFADGLTSNGRRLYELAQGNTLAEKEHAFKTFVASWSILEDDAQEMVLLSLQGLATRAIAQVLLARYPQTKLSTAIAIKSRLNNPGSTLAQSIRTGFGLRNSELKSALLELKQLAPATATAEAEAVATFSQQIAPNTRPVPLQPATILPPLPAEPKAPAVVPPLVAMPTIEAPLIGVGTSEPALPATRALPDPSLPLLTQVERYWTEHTAHLPLLQTIKADAAELAQAVDAYNQNLPAGRSRLDLTFQQVMAVALYRRDADLKRNPQDGSVMFTSVNVNQKHDGNRQALGAFLNADSAALESSGLQTVFSALSPSYEPANFDPKASANTLRARALHYLDQFLDHSGRAAAVNPERQAALQALELMRLTGALTAEQASDVRALLMPARAGTTQPTTPNWKRAAGVVERDIRTYPYSSHNRRQSVEQHRKNALALLQGLGGSLDVGDAKTLQPTSFLFQVGLRALRDAHREGTETLLTQAWRTGRVPSAAEIQAQLFPRLNGEVRYVRVVVQAFMEEVRASIVFALEQRQVPGWSAQPLRAVQATAAQNMEMLITDVATSGDASKKARFVISLPQAADNRRATYAVLARLGPQMPRDVFVWTTSKFLAEGVVPAEARAALGNRFEIVTTPEELTARMIDKTARNKPLLVILGDDALSDAAPQVKVWLAACAKAGRRLVYVADEAQRLGRSDNSQRAQALAPLAQQAQVAIALSATPIGRKGNELGALAQWLGVLPAGELPRSPSLLFTQIAPHFLSGAAQRLVPTPRYVSVAYTPQAAQLALQNSKQNSGLERHTLGAQLDAVEKLPTVIALAQERVAANGKVLIGSSYLKDGVDTAASALAQTRLRHAKLDGRTPVAQRNELLRRFKLPAADPQALDVLISTWTAAEGSVAVDVNLPPPGGFEVIGLNVPQTPAYLAALTGMVNQESLGQDVPVRVSIPVMEFRPGQAGTDAAPASADQQAVDRFEQRSTASVNALSMGSGDMVEPTQSQLERYRLGRGYTGMSNEYFGTVEELEAYMEANDSPPPWQQATRYLDRQVAVRAKQLTAQNQSLRLADLGSGFNRLVTTAVENGSVSAENAVGLDLLPKEMVTQLVQRGKLTQGSDRLHVTGRIEDAAVLLAPWTSKVKFNLVTSSFSIMGKEPQLIASYFRAANRILETGGRLMILLPLSSFGPSKDATLKQGLAEMGFAVKRDEALKTVGASIRYLELERTKDPEPRVDVAKFLMK